MIATANLKITRCMLGEAVAVKVPHSELALEDTPTIHVREEDFPGGRVDDA